MAPVYVNDIYGMLKSDNGNNAKVDVFALYDQIETQKRHPFEMLFSYRKVSRRLPGMLKKWFEKKELLEPVLDLYFGNLYGKGYTQIQIFLNYVQALETYHKRITRSRYKISKEIDEDLRKIYSTYPESTTKWLKGNLSHANQPSLAVRLSELIEKNPRQIIGSHGDPSNFVKKVTKTRNYYIHYERSKRAKAATGGELRGLSRTLGIMIEGFLLKELGFKIQIIQDMQQNRRRLPILWY